LDMQTTIDDSMVRAGLSEQAALRVTRRLYLAELHTNNDFELPSTYK
jgi:hypothetical protein